MPPRRQLIHAALVIISSFLILNNAVVQVKYILQEQSMIDRLPKNRSATASSLGVREGHGDSLNFCGRSNLVFISEAEYTPDEAGGHSLSDVRMTIPVDYPCTGDSYENYTRHYLRPYAETVARNSSWGRRRFPLPGNVSVLVLGNSHTKQTVIALLCQYADVVRSVTPLGPSDIHPPNLAYFFEIRFLNSASLVFLGNHPLVYSRSWAENIRRFDPRRRNLQDYDAVVLGKFNQYDAKFRNSFLFAMLLSFQHRHPGLIDVENDPCPSLIDVADQYNRSIVVLPMFTGFAHAWTKQAIGIAKGLRSSQNRSNIRVARTRAHIQALGVECGSSADRMSVGTCIDNDGAHRCSGRNGGDADLMAWDLIESLYGAIP